MLENMLVWIILFHYKDDGCYVSWKINILTSAINNIAATTPRDLYFINDF